MLEAIKTTLTTMGWLGIVFAILVITNTVAGALANVWSGEESFSISKLGKGLLKSLVFYISAVLIGIAFTMLPYINEMITSANGQMLLSTEMLDTLSSVGVLAVVVSAIVVQGKKAISNILKLANISSGDEEQITWNVVEEETEETEE